MYFAGIFIVGMLAMFFGFHFILTSGKDIYTKVEMETFGAILWICGTAIIVSGSILLLVV